jgi:hypothetical protein
MPCENPNPLFMNPINADFYLSAAWCFALDPSAVGSLKEHAGRGGQLPPPTIGGLKER